ncbi:hypothetical protein COW36_04985 [bacterium (Candidatus Blackallbacteria) CG17_big_fil_post_rev_8_21_14_2_50_48_46]|uniref:Probable queuosine precursor transporter n=1 Tax=bacterium (Candidatus Blackallbacteria) CG17_big_fil_post_rev_8_21_14_2_50_48_46 TaxID=2014261 RepID=A0A2M7G9D3_9BACT|nr:MAG: hypothetical protein COW64_03960 [bacterium (Candidatus Blackallbacteria) CG18_big_fil_WC_8_21_14_2_50_49_26]PIW18651.1 MAG: hypothetical protein COW36_04985 [bacterium (Candidatus Blackallbacteria) CG17_big_fil_post_rev_8_21_14_2_50_48_46]PIW46363.1 MAG: hypothetical protein COW20_15695 [bacterium (Candidatus Blackallbacteria) CG13_big_fil_rev_8_21_14_2_50_49_14]
MIHAIVRDRSTVLFLLLSCFFVTNALIAEFIGVKIFSLEQTLGLQPVNFTLLGQSGLAFNLTAGVLLWPFVFVFTDLINEYYGKKAVSFLSWMTAGLVFYAFAMFYLGMHLPPAGFWPGSSKLVPDMNKAFQAVFGQGLWIIMGSMVAFLLGQLLDITVFQLLKHRTGEKALWLRATGSTLVSQWVDSFVVLFIAFYLGAGWSFQLVLAIGLVNYVYKVLCALVMIPVIYGVHFAMDHYLGHEVALKMRASALHPVDE